MSRYCFILVSVLSIAYTNIVIAGQQHQSKYAGQEKRIIKSLSENDIQQLKSGKGWGLAKAAELNGVPGPSHIMQMKDKISLTHEQEAKVRTLFEEMQSQAIPLGKKLIQLEKNLNESFANKSVTSVLLNQQLESISIVHKELRYLHLVTHLKTPDILTSQQIEKYN